jgi:hypothetical protein
MRLLRRLLLSAVMLAPAVASGCSAITGDDDAGVRFATMYVAPQKAPCELWFPTECLLVRPAPTAEWEYFTNAIHGFEWEPGFSYRIRVMIREIENPPADGSSLEYRLVQLLEKAPAQ